MTHSFPFGHAHPDPEPLDGQTLTRIPLGQADEAARARTLEKARRARQSLIRSAVTKGELPELRLVQSQDGTQRWYDADDRMVAVSYPKRDQAQVFSINRELAPRSDLFGPLCVVISGLVVAAAIVAGWLLSH